MSDLVRLPRPAWPTCTVCSGVKTVHYDQCLAHLRPDQRNKLLSDLGPGGNVDGRGISFTESLARELLGAVRDPNTRDPQFGSVDFEGAHFFGDIDFTRSVFTGDANFREVKFGANAIFTGAAFGGGVDFSDAKFAGTANFSWVNLGASARLGPCTAKSVNLSDSQITRAALVQWNVERVDAERVRCPEAFNLQLTIGKLRDGAGGSEPTRDISIDAPRVYSPALLTLSYSNKHLKIEGAAFESPSTIVALRRGDQRGDTPKLLSLKRVDAAKLVLVRLDLRSCQFMDCYNRDGLRIEGPPQFEGQPTKAERPSGVHRRVIIGWARRLVIAEEHSWRFRYDKHPAGWFPEDCQHSYVDSPNKGGDSASEGGNRASDKAREEAARIQAIYRDLRKGREDAKDSPGAADFYYGEMEMRRLATPVRTIERVLLASYWLLAGYGLRASRAVGAFFILLIIGTAGFTAVGFAASNHTEYRYKSGFNRGISTSHCARSSPGLEGRLRIQCGERYVTVPGRGATTTDCHWPCARDQPENYGTVLA